MSAARDTWYVTQLATVRRPMVPLTALLSDEVLDATVLSLSRWQVIHRPAVPVPLSCRDCGGVMHAKQSRYGTRFFAHNVRPGQCAWAGESSDHQRLKAWLAHVVREAGGSATVEATPTGGDERRWRADVLVSSVDGRRFALEVQLSALTVAEAIERTERYRRDGVQAVWITTRGEGWRLRVPTLEIPSARATTATRGAARWRDGLLVPAGDVSLEAVVTGLVRGTVDVLGPVLSLGTEQDAIDASILSGRPGQYVMLDAQQIPAAREADTLRVTRVKAEAAAAAELRERARAARRAQREAATERSHEATAAAQLVRAVQLGPATRERVNLGPRARRLAAELVVPRLEAHLRAQGYERFGYSGSADASQVSGSLPARLGGWREGSDGLAVWAARPGATLTLVGIVCPDAGGDARRHAQRWERTGWHVYASCAAEAEGVAAATGRLFARRFLQVFDVTVAEVQLRTARAASDGTIGPPDPS